MALKSPCVYASSDRRMSKPFGVFGELQRFAGAWFPEVPDSVRLHEALQWMEKQETLARFAALSAMLDFPADAETAA